MTILSTSDRILDAHARLAVEFVRQTGLEARLLAGAPSLLELGLISYGLALGGLAADVYFAGDDGKILHSRPFTPDVQSLVAIMREKFGKAALLISKSALQMAFFNHSNDYFMFLGGSSDLESIFHLNDEKMMEYFRDIIEGSSDEGYLCAVWGHYADNLLLPKLPQDLS